MAAVEYAWTPPADHPAFAGHFPGRPIVPGVVLLDQAILFAETMLGMHRVDRTTWQVGNAKFFSPVGPEEALTFILTPKPSGAILFIVRTAERDVASGSLTASPE